MSTTPAVFAGAIGASESLPRLADRRASWYTKEVAHIMEGARCDLYGRRIGLAVVILTTVVGTSIFVTLGENPQWAAKLTVGFVGVAAAVAAAWKENAQYEKRSQSHETAGGKYEHLRYGVEELRDKLAMGVVSREVAEKQLEEFENTAEKLATDAPALPDKAITNAVAFIKKVRQERKELVDGP